MTSFDGPGDDSVVTVLAAFADAGWTANHLVCPGGVIECGDCHEVSAAAELDVAAQHRVEGASDPDDMQIVLGFPCPRCGAKGAVVAAYGPTASENDADFMSTIVLSTDEDPLATA